MSKEQNTSVAWSSEDSIAAAAQGWGIFSTSRDAATEKELVNGKPYGHRPYELQRDDELGIIKSDGAAHTFVATAAKSGDGLAQRALAYLQAFSPIEYAAIVGVIDRPIRVFHALSDVEQIFDFSVGADYAVAYCYCEENHRLSELFSHREDGNLAQLLAKLPMMRGKQSVGCGDWMAATR